MKSAVSAASSSRSVSSTSVTFSDGGSSLVVAAVNVTPRMTTPWTSAARKSVDPRRSSLMSADKIASGGLGGQFAFDGGDQLSSDVDVELPIEFTDSRWARHVDLGQVVADDVEAGEQYAFRRQRRSDLQAEPAVALRQRTSLAACTHDEIAAALAGCRYSRERIVDRHAVDQKDALVALDDLRNEALRESESLAVVRQRLDDDVRVQVARGHDEDRAAAHAVERFQNDFAVFLEEL